MKTRKQMRNVFIRKIDDILIRYYKEINFDLLVSTETGEIRSMEATYLREVLELLALMHELELISDSEHVLLRQVYREYFSLATPR